MQIIEREQNDVTVFTLEGRIGSEGAVDLELALQAAASAGKRRMVLDMTNVPYINSAGLRTLADVLTQNRREGGDLRLVGLSPKVKRVFQVIGFDRFFAIDASVDEAVAAY